MGKATDESAEAPLPRRQLGRHKRQLQTRIATMLAGIFTVWAFLFLPDALFAEIRAIGGVLGEFWGGLSEIAVRGGVSLFLVFSARWIIFAQDSLAMGRGRWSDYFRSFFVDGAIMDQYKCTKKEATTLWFRYFNRWETACDEYKQYHRLTFSRTYSCRLVYHLRQWLLYFVVFGAITLTLNKLLAEDFDRWAICLIAIVAAGSLSAFLHYANKIPKSNSEEVTGCWKKYKEIAEIQSVLLDRDILRRAETYDEAWELVAHWPAPIPEDHT